MYKKVCGRYEFNDYQKLIREALEQALDEYNKAYERVGVLDLMELDLRHFLEDETLNAPKVNKIGSKIRKIRLERREQKAKVSYLHDFIAVVNKMNRNGTLTELLNPQLLKYNDCLYKPRIVDLDYALDIGKDDVSES